MPGTLHSSAWIRPRKRWAIYVRDSFTCVYCGSSPEFLQLDHLFPRASRWRDNDHRRLVTVCPECNNRKGRMPLSDWLRQLASAFNDSERAIKLNAIYRRLQTARYVPLNRKAGDRALAAHRAWETRPLPPLPDYIPQNEDGIPF